MKVKNRRGLNRTELNCDETVPNEEFQVQKRRKNVENSHSLKPCRNSNAISPVTSNAKANRKKRVINTSDTTLSVTSVPFKGIPSNPSNSSSSASSIVSGSGDTADPYEFAVKADEEQNSLMNNHINGSSGSSSTTVKRLKLDRCEDKSLSDSCRSSPLAHTIFSQPSPGANSSPLTVHCTRPLSVLTDFSSSSSSLNRTNTEPDMDQYQSRTPAPLRIPITCCGPFVPFSESLTARPAPSIVGDCSSPLMAFTRGGAVKNGINRADTPVTAPAMDAAIQPRSPYTTDSLYSSQTYPSTPPHPGSVQSQPSSSPPPPTTCLVARSAPTSKLSHRTACVNTILDTCKATLTEPDLPGPCEPGTTICLNGIVWLETTTGVLVVNVTWRGRTYIGTLLDATQHDFAPLCPRDYVPAFKSNAVRSSNRTKRRNGITGSYKQHYNVTDGRSTTTSGTQRHRLRGRNTGSPPTAGSGVLAPVSDSPASSAASDVPTSVPLTASKDQTNCGSTKLDAPLLGNLNNQCDEDVCLDSSSGKANEPQERDDNIGGSVLLNHRLSGDLHLVNRINQEEQVQLSQPIAATPESKVKSFTSCPAEYDPSSRPKSPNSNEDELRNLFPISCPLDGCQKRFTNVIALRFHLNHTRHDPREENIKKNSQHNCNEVAFSESLSNCRSDVNTESPPTISPPCFSSPIHPTVLFTQDSTMTSMAQDAKEQSTDETMHRLEATVLTAGGSDSSSNTRSSNLPWHFPRVSSSSNFVPTCAFETCTTPSTTRTVTAHTVSVPYGSSTATPDTLGNSARSTSNINLSVNKQRSQNLIRGETNKSRSQSMKFPIHKVDSHSVSSPRQFLDLLHALPVAPRALSNSIHSPNVRPDNPLRDPNSTSQFSNSLAVSLREPVDNQLPLNNQLVPLPPGAWNFANLTPAEQQRLHQHPINPNHPIYDNGSHTLDSMQLNGSLSAHNRSISNLPLYSPINLSSYTPLSSETTPVTEFSHPTFTAATTSRPTANSLIDQSPFYGIPDFLVAAAINALSSGGMSNPAEMARSYLSSNAPGNAPTPVQPTTSGMGVGVITSSSMKRTTISPPQLVVPPSLNSALTNSGPPVLPPSLFHGLATGSPHGSTQPGHNERMDAFKLSAAYFMQQAAAGSQFPPTFSQQPT